MGWVRRLFLLLVVGVTIVLSLDRVGGRVKLQWEILAAQRDLLAFSESRGRLIFDGNAENTDAHLREGGFESVTHYQSTTHPSYRLDQPWAVAASGLQARHVRLQDAIGALGRWNELREMPQTPAGSGGGGSSSFFGRVAHSQAVFFGDRTAGASPARIVRINLTTSEDPLQDGSVGIDYAVIRTAGVFSDFQTLNDQTATVTTVSGTVDLVLTPQDARRGVKIYAVTPDPADASRLTIDYEMNGGRGTIEGKLQPNDTISWAVLSGPAMTH